MRMAGGTERQHSPIEIDVLIYVRQPGDASPLEPDVKGHGKVGEKFGPIRMIYSCKVVRQCFTKSMVRVDLGEKTRLQLCVSNCNE